MAKKIKSVTHFKMDAVFVNGPENPPEFEKYKFSFTEFDQNGNVILEEKYTPDESLTEKQKYTYDEKGNLIEEKNFLDTGELADHRTYEHDEEGRIVKEFRHYSDETKDTITYKRDSMGNVVEKSTIDFEDDLEAKDIITYKNGKILSHKRYEYDELVMDESYEYTKDGKLSRTLKWTADDENARFENNFDEHGNLVKSMKYNEKEQLIQRIITSYNSENKPIRIEEESVNGKSIMEAVYDERGNAIKQTEKDGKGNIMNQVNRIFNEDNQVTEAEVHIDFHGRSVNQYYKLKYEYTYFD